MTRFFGRRAVLVALAMPFVTQRAHARAPFRLRGDPQPLLSPPIVDESGRHRRLEDFGSRVILLNIWATWCPPCREEMPMLDRLQARIGTSDFLVLPLCIDDAGIDRGRRFYIEIGIANLPLFWAESLRVQLALAFVGLPTTLLIDRESREIGRLQGPFDWDSDDTATQIRGLL